MEQKSKNKKRCFLYFLAITAVFCGITLYAAAFPTTMRLLDEKTEELMESGGLSIKFSAFSDFSEISRKIINGAEYIFETVKYNLENKDIIGREISAVVITCAAKFPSDGEKITSGFGNRKDPFSGKADFHRGIDIAALSGSNIYSAWPGKVSGIGYDDINGKYIIIDHSEGFYTKYCHLSDISIELNAFINAGEKIGEAGSTGRSTGSHLHFEVNVGGMNIDPGECLAI